jgi:hypothetical protein
MDGLSVFPIGLWFLHWSDLTFAIALISVLFFALAERLSLPFPLVWIRLRALLVGKLRPGGDPGPRGKRR